MSDAVLALLAHPDDAEFLCAGVLARLAREHGWRVHIASMTAGDCGSAEHTAEEISRIRRAEGAASAALLGGAYHCLEEPDLNVFYSERTLAKATRLMREVRARLVLVHSPSDYHLDHEQASVIGRAAAFSAPIPLYLKAQGGPPPLDHVPHVYYCDPIEGKDLYGRPVPPDLAMDVGGVIDLKERMLACHASQREWLRKHHGMDQYLMAMREWSGTRGREYGVAFAEGFRQHRGHSYPQSDLLGDLLGRLPAPAGHS
jgi:LmbE family N-acetylglucosaminyl deacetylase